jgi:medium-chain acyl-[acyl-carrier-protein] hydrolase
MFCLPYAGASASVYSRWVTPLAPSIELRAVELPGRGHRFREPPERSVSQLVKRLADELGGMLEAPYVLFGHSMGALLCFELARHLASLERPMPEKLILSGFPAPQMRRRDEKTYDLPDAEFIATLKRYNGMQEEILANTELMELLLPVLRADLGACQTYQYEPGPPLVTSIIALGGDRDPVATREELLGWRELVTGSISLHMFPGDHFFIHSSGREVRGVIERELRSLCDKR